MSNPTRSLHDRHDAKLTLARARRRRADPAAARAHAPAARRGRRRACRRELGTVLPAVTCSAQSTFLDRARCRRTTASSATGGTSATSARCSCGASTTGWSRARRSGRPPARRDPGYKVANVCWWYAMGIDDGLRVTPRPIYHADGTKSPDCYTCPPELHDELISTLGRLPAVLLLGPERATSSPRAGSSRPPATPACRELDLTLVYVPHLDYDLQRFGPDGAEAVAAAREVDARAGAAARRRQGPRRHGRGAQRVRHHRRQPPGRHQPAAAPRGAAQRLHPGRHGVPRPVDVARVRGGRPPGRPRLRPRTRPTCRGCAQLLRGAARRRRGPRPRGPGGVRPRPRALRRAGARGRARTPGSPTTTGSTTPRRPTSPAPSRSTASPATTPRSCSSTRTTRW